MVNNQQCDFCDFAVKCKVKTKLKPFTDEAKVDLGVEITFVSCDNFTRISDDASEEE